MNKKKIIINLFFFSIILFLVFGVMLIYKNKFTINENNYEKKAKSFNNCDEVVYFLNNLYESDNAKIVVKTDEYCDVEAYSNEEEIYKYRFFIEKQQLFTIDELDK